MSFTYRELNSAQSPAAGGDYIGKCQTLLPNRMQCTKAASYEVTETPDLPEGEKPAAPAISQHCRLHLKFKLAGLDSGGRSAIQGTGTVDEVLPKV